MTDSECAEMVRATLTQAGYQRHEVSLCDDSVKVVVQADVDGRLLRVCVFYATDFVRSAAQGVWDVFLADLRGTFEMYCRQEFGHGRLVGAGPGCFHYEQPK